jgi:sugar/nucleoside kinase (ribokinase family)
LTRLKGRCNNIRMIEVLCAGQLAADILVRPVDRLDFVNDTQRVECIEIKNGGDSLNVAVGLQKLGHRVGFAGKIGDDLQGDFLVRTIDQAGIDGRGLVRGANIATCTVIVMINSSGERTFFYLGGANDRFTLEDINWSLLDEAAVVHVGGTYLLPQFDGDGAAQLFREARSAGKLTSMDVTWDTRDRWRKTIEPCFPHLSFFFPSYKEAEKITGKQNPEEMAALLREWGVQNVVIKLGAEGCYVKPEAGPGFFVPACATTVVDTTGAGDSFVAGFLSGLLRRWDLGECAGFACAVAALNIQSVGATGGMPTFEQAMQFKNRREN